MRIGSIGWLTNQGQGRMVQAFKKHIGIDEMIGCYHPSRSLREDWIDDGVEVTGVPLKDHWVEELLEKVDVLLLSETGFNPFTYQLARLMGKKVVLIPMWEFVFWGQWQHVDWFIAPTLACYDFITRNLGFENVTHIPWPLDLDEFEFRQRKNCYLFLHNAGWLGWKYIRKGTREVVRAFNDFGDEGIPCYLRSQMHLPDDMRPEKNVWVNRENTDDASECYHYGDVAIQPSRWEGIGFTILEAMACGIPVMTTDAKPMNEYFPDERFLIKAKMVRNRRIENPSAPEWEIDIKDLREKVRALYRKDISKESRNVRKIIEDTYNWDVQRNKFCEVLEGVYKGKLTRHKNMCPDDFNREKLPFKTK